MEKGQESRIKEKFSSGHYIMKCGEEDCPDIRKATMEEFLWFVAQNDNQKKKNISNIGKKIWEEMKTM